MDTIPPNRRLVCVADLVTDDTDTPLGVMIRILLNRYGYRVPVLYGEGFLTGFPVLEAVADGMLLVMYAVSTRQLDEPIRSSREVTSVWAPRFDRVFQTGLLLVHKTPERAALAFERDVIAPVLTGAQADWSRPSAAFFAALLKEARVLREAIESLGAELHRLLTGDKRLIGGNVCESLLLNNDLHRQWLDVRASVSFGRQVFARPTSTRSVRHEDVPVFMRGRQSALKRECTVIRALLQLPFQLGDLPESVLDRHTIISYGAGHVYPRWVETQIWLALTDAPVAQQHLTMALYAQAQEVFHDEDDRAVCERFFARMIARGAAFDAHTRAILEGLVRQQIEHMRAYRSRLDPLLQDSLYLEMDLGQMEMDGKDALEIAMGEAPDLIAEHAMSRQERCDTYDQGILSKVDFRTLTAEDVRTMIERSNIPVDLIARRMFEMPEPEWREVVDWMLTEQHLTRRALEYLAEADMLTVDVRFLVHAPELVPSVRRSALVSEALHLNDGSHRFLERGLTHGAVLIAMERLSDGELEALCETPTDRMALVTFVDSVLEYREGSTMNALFRLRRRLHAMGLWDLVALAYDVLEREGEYADDRSTGGETRSLDGMMRRWDDLGPEASSHTLVNLFERPEQARHAYTSYTEDDVAAWLFAGQSNRKKRLRAYRASREAYYARTRTNDAPDD